jgi:hypothetical protein
MINARQGHSGVGTQNASLSYGGFAPLATAVCACTELFTMPILPSICTRSL